MTERIRMEPQPPADTYAVDCPSCWLDTWAWIASSLRSRRRAFEAVMLSHSATPPPNMPNARPVQDADGVWWWVNRPTLAEARDALRAAGGDRWDHQPMPDDDHGPGGAGHDHGDEA